MSNNSNKVYEATDHATFDSKRKGNWATIPEINTRLDAKISENIHTVLTRLVKDKRIEKKKDAVMYRTKKGGGGGLGSLFNEGYRSPDPYDNPRGDSPTSPNPYGGDRTNEPKTGRGDEPTKPDGRTTTGGNVAAAVETMIVGGSLGATGGSTGGATTNYTGPR